MCTTTSPQNHQILSLNTKSCCFLCFSPIILKNGEIFRSSKNEKDINMESSLEILCRHLKINVFKTLEEFLTTPLPHLGENQANSEKSVDVKVKLCETCANITETFTDLLYQLEKVKLELDHCIKTFHQRITDNFKNVDLVKNYSNLMTSNGKTLQQLGFVDKLRNKIATKCSEVRVGPQPKIILTKCKSKASGEIIFSSATVPTNSNDKSSSVKLFKLAEIEMAAAETPIYFADDNNLIIDDPLLEEDTANQSDSECEASSPKVAFVEMKPAVNDTLKIPNVSSFPKRKTFVKKTIYNKKSQMYHCRLCNFKTGIYNRAHLHYDRKHVEHRCKTCGNFFTNSTNLRVHIDGIHKNLRPFPCNLCEKKFKQKVALIGHKKRHHFKKD